MARKLTAHSVELAARRAQRAELERKADDHRRKALGASDRVEKLAHQAKEKEYRFQAQSLKLRKGTARRSSGGADLLTITGRILGGR